MKLTMLGTAGGAAIQSGRCQTGLLVEIGEQYLLLDCGGGVVRRLARVPIHLPDISFVFFTHYHSDHLVDYPAFVLSSWVMGRRGPLRVFGPPGINQINTLLFGQNGVFNADIRSRLESEEVRQAYWARHGSSFERPLFESTEIPTAGKILEGDDFTVSATIVEHVPSYMTCLAYRIVANEGSIVFSGDTRPLEQLALFAQGADILVHDCSRPDSALKAVGFDQHHTGPLALGQIANAAGVKKVIMTHFSAVVGGSGIVSKMVDDVKRNFHGEVLPGHDLLSVEL